MPAGKLLRRRTLQQSAGDALRSSENLVVNNSAYRIEYTLGDDAPEIRAATRVLASFIEEPFYSELRTRQQLGYIVHGSAGDELRSHFAYFIIQSGDYAADVVAARAATRIGELPGLLAELPDDGWQTIVGGVRAELEEKDKTIAERAGRLFDLAYDFDGEWDRREATLAALDKLTKARVQEMQAKVVEAQAQVPLAMAEAFRSGRLGVMDYYRMENVQSDTQMRSSIAHPEGRSESGPARP